MEKIIKSLEGYKTYVVALAAIIWGLHTNNMDLILIGLGLAGIRNGVSGEVGKLLMLTKTEEPKEVVASV